MAALINMDGTDEADVLLYNRSTGMLYHTKAGNDKVTIEGGTCKLVNDGGNDIININGGTMHVITGGTGNEHETLIINGGDGVEAQLGSGNDKINIIKSNGRKTSGGNAKIYAGNWTDTFITEADAQNYQLYGENGNDIFNINGGKNINFWGGSNNDTFIVKAGTNLKLYGGDSDDLFEIHAANQNMILGYGRDTVNIYTGNNQQIKGNLGINQINLLVGTGHVITADIDQAASKLAHKDVGYGVDNVVIDGASQVTANLGDGRDTVEIKSGSGHKIYTEGWNDTVTISGDVSNSFINTGTGNDTIYVQGGKNITILGGDGDDTLYVDWEKLQGKVELTRDTAYYMYENDIDNVIHINEALSLFKRTLDVKKGVLTLSQEGTEKAVSVLGNNHTFVFKDCTKTFDQLCVPTEVSYTVEEGETKSINGTLDIAEIYVNGGHATEIKTGKANDYLEVNGGLAEKVDLGEGKNMIVLNDGELKGVVSTGNNHITINGGSYTSEGFGNVFHYASGNPVGSNTYYINGGTNLELSSGWGVNEYYIDCSKLSCDVVIHRPYYRYGVLYGLEDLYEFDASSKDVIYLQNANLEAFTRSWDEETKILTMSNGRYSISFDNYMYDGVKWYDDYGGDPVPLKVIFDDKTLEGKELYTHYLNSGKLESFIGTDLQNNVWVDGAEVGEIKLLGSDNSFTMNSGHVETVDAGIGNTKINGGSIDTLTCNGYLNIYDGSIDTITGDVSITMDGGTVNTVRLVGEQPEDRYYNDRETFQKGTIDELWVEGKNRSITLKADMVVNKYYCVNSSSVLTNYSQTPLTAYLGEKGSVTAYGKNGTYYGENGSNGISLVGSNNTGYGGAGDDSISVRGTGNIGYGDEGNDRLELDGNIVTVVGGKGTDNYEVRWGRTARNMLIDNSTAGTRDLDDVWIYDLNPRECQTQWDETDHILKLSKGSSNLYLKDITSTNFDKITFLYDTYYNTVTKSYTALVSEATKVSGLLEEIKAASLILAMESADEMVTNSSMEENQVMVFGSK